MVLAGTNTADSLVLTEAGAITDAPGASLIVIGQASFGAGANAITLGDDSGDVINFGMAEDRVPHFSGQSPTIVAAR